MPTSCACGWRGGHAVRGAARVGLAAAFGAEEIHECGHGAQVGRVELVAAVGAALYEAGALESLGVKTQDRCGDAQLFRDDAGRMALRATLYQQAVEIEPLLVAECGHGGRGLFRLHISRIAEISSEVQFSFARAQTGRQREPGTGSIRAARTLRPWHPPSRCRPAGAVHSPRCRDHGVPCSGSTWISPRYGRSGSRLRLSPRSSG